MSFQLTDVTEVDETPQEFLDRVGRVFARFDEHTQDSGNISYGVEIAGAKYFVKTAGLPENRDCFLSFERRTEFLQNAIRLWEDCPDPALPKLEHVIGQSPYGPILIYEWSEGELLSAPRARREDPDTAFQRFRQLPVMEILAALNTLYRFHDRLTRAGWIAVDLYDGCLMYDFGQKRLRVIDFDMYHPGAFTNVMGRMFGSSRFMAPEEWTCGARIDQRTTVFTLARFAAVFLSDGTLERSTWRGTERAHTVMTRACAEQPEGRYSTVAEFYAAWMDAQIPPA